MKSPQEVYEEIILSHQELERIPPDVHLFCPRTSDDDPEDYEGVEAAEGDDDSEPGAADAAAAAAKKGTGEDPHTQLLRTRVRDGQRRLQLTAWASLILGISREQADRWLGDWVRRTETFLVKCDACVRAWHAERKPLKARLLKEFDEETANIMEARLHEYDTARIDRGLRRAVTLLETHGPMSSSKLLGLDAAAVLAFYEALCCVEYLSVPENRRLFNYVFQKTQEKKPLRIASAVIPTMTVFLFQPDPLRNAFARTAWARRKASAVASAAAGSTPQAVAAAYSLTPEQFEWAVSDHLADAIDAVSRPDAPDSAVILFWDGFLLLLDAMSEHIVLHCLRGMQIPLDVYQLAVRHLERSADPAVLARVLRALCALMDKSSKAFWDALALMNPPQLPMFVCASPAFGPLLARSFDESMQVDEADEDRPPAADGAADGAPSNRRRTPLLVAFVRSLMRSLGRNQRADVCDYFLSVFLSTDAPASVTTTPEGHSTCVAAGLTALQMTLDGYRDARTRLTAETSLFVNTVINNTVRHHDYVERSANLHPADRYNIGLSQAAVAVVEAALALDTRAMHDEWTALQLKKPPAPAASSAHQTAAVTRTAAATAERRSSQLWSSFRSSLGPGRLDLARPMLAATLALRGIQQFPPKKRQVVVDDEAKRSFNAELDRAAEAIASTVERISECLSRADLHRLLGLSAPTAGSASNPSMDAVVAMLVHAEDPIRGAAFELLGAVVDEDSRSEAVVKMVHSHPAMFLTSFANTVGFLAGGVSGDPQAPYRRSPSPFPPMRHIFRCGRDILNGLCDTSGGLLRSRTLTPDERAAVKRWWTTAWLFVDHSFLRARAWSEDVEKATMENYCRDVMEFAEELMAQDGLVASALTGESSGSSSGSAGSGSGSGTSTPIATTTNKQDAAMQEVLDAPRKYSMGLFEMIQLRDLYLVGIIVRILVKLFTRLKEFNMNFPDKFVDAIRSTYIHHEQFRSKYKVNTNMDDTQRAELMKAIGDGVEGDDDDAGSGVEIISWSSAPSSSTGKLAQPKKKQTSLEAWAAGATSSGLSSGPSSRAASSAPGGMPALPSLSSKDAASQLTPGLNRHKAMLDKMKATAAARTDSKALLANRAAIREARARDKAEMDKHKAEAIARARALRGGPPVVAKSEIMVDSVSEDDDEDDDDDDDDDEGGMSQLLQHSKKNAQLLGDAERQRRLALQQMAARQPVKKIKLQRSAKDMRARIIPNMDRLHQAILEWDIFHEGNDPPNSRGCEAVADAYPSPAEYKRTFFPLLISEAWRSFVTAKDETTSKPFGIKVVTRMSVDNFLEVSTAMPAKQFSAGSGGGGGGGSGERAPGEGDIVLLSRAQDPLTGRGEPHCLARIWKTAYKRDSIEVTYRLNSRGNQILPLLVPGAEFRAVKITNMTTIEREFAALESLQYYDLMDEVIKATPSPMLTFGEGAIADTMQTYGLNRGQALAILHGRANDGFTLVQGPPGTGKTKTIVAMVGALLTGQIKNANAGAVALARPGGPKSSSDAPAKKLLVCAPSNAAVDELVLRLKQGVKETTGVTRKINVLRLGRSDVINDAVKDVTLDELVKAAMEQQTSSSSSGGGEGGKDGKDGKDGKAKDANVSDREKMHLRAGEIKVKVQEVLAALEAARSSDEVDRNLVNQLQRTHDQLRSEQRRIGAQIERDKESGNTYAREAEIRRRQIQQRILAEAHVLCATLSGSGHEVFKQLSVEFETVIIDEAAQCVELSALIPLKYGCAKCVLVGDPKQLPPTVLSQSAARYGYDQSLFVRMQRNRPQDVHLLDTQYRMHPEISRFPSREFYEGRLIDGADMAPLRTQPWHRNGGESLLGPYRFFDVEGVQARGHKGQSLVNENEVRVAIQLYRRFLAEWAATTGGRSDARPKIGIITPYKAQLYALRQRFADQFPNPDSTAGLEFNTTDAFQGRECDIIIFSCVRASPTGGIGFMTDIRRMNVGLTRARSSLWILGDSRALRQGEFWRALIEDAKERNRYTAGNVLALLKAGPSAGGGRAAPAAPAAPATPATPAAPSSNGKSSGQRASTNTAKPAPANDDDDDDDDSYSPPPASAMVASASAPSPLPPARKTQPPAPPPPRGLAPPATYTVVGRPGRPPPAPNEMGLGGINERGEPLPYGPSAAAAATRPQIQSSAADAAAASRNKKRPHSGSGGGGRGGGGTDGPVKRTHLNNAVPTGPRAAATDQQRRTDPSAMAVLGMAKPEDAAARPVQKPPRPPIRPPKKKTPVDPFIKKKQAKR